MINSLTVPSVVATSYAPAGEELISVVLIGHLALDDKTAESLVRKELTEWFGSVVEKWRHLKTYRIPHALPAQPPPMPDPTVPAKPVKPCIYVCGEYQSVPGIQWALLSGRHAAEAVIKELAETPESMPGGCSTSEPASPVHLRCIGHKGSREIWSEWDSS